MQAELDLLSLTPVILVCAAAIAVMLGIAWQRHHAVTALATALGLNLALIAVLLIGGVGTEGAVTTPLMVFDGISISASVLVLASALACVTLSHAYLEGYPGPKEEFYLLLLCATAGALVLVSSQHFATVFFGLELLSMPLYGMLAYTYRDERSLEAGVKYLVLSAAASAFLLFGMALVYSQTGGLSFDHLANSLPAESNYAGVWVMAGASLMLVGLGFKLSLVPFHLWTPDVYQGSPGPAAAFLATASKLAVFVVLMRLVIEVPVFRSVEVGGLFAALAMLTMLAGNLLALVQSNLKRLLGYSSIAHFGYLLVTLVVARGMATETAGVYLATYLLATLGAFGVVTLLSSPYSGEDASALHHYRGLFWRRPYLAAILTIMLLSLAGIPFTAGFIGKFYIIALGVEAGRWWLVAAVVLGSVIGLYYYLRVMVTLYLVEPGMMRRDAPNDWGARACGLVVFGLALLVLALGIYPSPLVEWTATIGFY